MHEIPLYFHLNSLSIFSHLVLLHGVPWLGEEEITLLSPEIAKPRKCCPKGCPVAATCDTSLLSLVLVSSISLCNPTIHTTSLFLQLSTWSRWSLTSFKAQWAAGYVVEDAAGHKSGVELFWHVGWTPCFHFKQREKKKVKHRSVQLRSFV